MDPLVFRSVYLGMYKLGVGLLLGSYRDGIKSTLAALQLVRIVSPCSGRTERSSGAPREPPLGGPLNVRGAFAM